MRYYAVYDNDGNIATILGQPDDAPPLRPAALHRGQRLTELALPEGVVDPADPDNLTVLLDLVADRRADVATARARSDTHASR
ncbi:hypothetical protein IFM12275_34680 [Nocardia sputorum]|uniref:hypothetical protein n=1 Tax=Nocardia sputorum TaxID=2984338 RepID=UPI002490EFE0|nr:hypothetical protein [Nocardia sputorum]BDT93492.1 hypothetical protein IFM12275_34680 [Nocardia sputorum]